MSLVYAYLTRKKELGKKSLAVLVDPDKTDHLGKLLRLAEKSAPDFFFVGGSELQNGSPGECIAQIRKYSNVPIVLFPGNTSQVSPDADALLLLSLISGRNPDLLIGKHVQAASALKKSKLELLPTGYMLIESGNRTTVERVSGTVPIPRDNFTLAADTALAGEQLGLKLIYLEAGSGAQMPVPAEMVLAVREVLSVPLITGGGLRKPEDIAARCAAGADLIVTGNVLEQEPELLPSFVQTVQTCSR